MPPAKTSPTNDDRSTRGRTAADIMTPSPRTCSPFSTITEAALIFRDHDCGAIPVLEDGRPVGILTDRDVALAAGRYPDLPGRPVSDIMTPDPLTVTRETPLEEVKTASTDRAVRRVLVVDPDGRLAGIISWADLASRMPEGEIGRVVSGILEPTRSDERGGASTRDRRANRTGDVAGTDRTSGEGRSWPSPKKLWGLIRETVGDFMEDKVPRLGAALAFYSVLSLAPMLLIAIAVAAQVFGQEAARGHLVEQIRGLVGKEGGEAIESMLVHAQKPGAGAVASILGALTLLVGATGVVGQLQDALNTIWEVAPKPGRGAWGFIRDRFLSLAMVFGVGFLLLVSLVLTTALTALGSFFGGLISQAAPVLEVANFAVTLVVVTLLFALIYKLLPDVHIAWGDVWVGAALTALLFGFGKSLIGLYLGRSGLGSAYGAAGSLVVLLVWVYYSSQILFFGAEFTKVYAAHFGSRIVPAADAVPVTKEGRAQQGIARKEDIEDEARAAKPR